MVAAGAGSGKTFTLTRRIAYGLLAGEEAPGGLQSIDEVLAITFTGKAAAELRDGIRALLREEGLAEESLKVDDAWGVHHRLYGRAHPARERLRGRHRSEVRGDRRGGGELPSGRSHRAGARPSRSGGRSASSRGYRRVRAEGAGALSTRGSWCIPRRWWLGYGRCPRGSRACACPCRPPRLRALCDRLWRLPGKFRRW